ncbi:hypothetical protein RBSWK_04611 [Rhodopirellula baltica SWK14]|uniref:Uncharacterized protein n=1 Tax=Rhodopirellula baltica SWK14 TaxID=993516 RepID=L7CBW6_RHOBT|nr:hypothetical protein RBSWK_04611 [Rhodopirellula baltica SWK14]
MERPSSASLALSPHMISIESFCVEKIAAEFVGFLRVRGDVPGDQP